MHQPYLGIHYFEDGLHYRQEDLHQWLPILRSLNLPWLILQSSARSSIPETFVRTLIDHNIQPTIHFQPALAAAPTTQEFLLLFKIYARWGIKHIVLFDRPNLRTSWPTAEWVRANPVDRLLDLFIPRAEAALEAGLTPLLPPLEPGGDYLDTVFLKTTLLGLIQRGQNRLAKSIAMAAYGRDYLPDPSRSLSGSERWREANPFGPSVNSKDHRGFHIASCYLTAAEEVLGFRPPVFLMQVNASTFISQHKLLPPEVIACSFWILSASQKTPAYPHAWFTPDGHPQPGARFLQNWLTAEAANLAQ
jgi:hypothetical protein